MIYKFNYLNMNMMLKIKEIYIIELINSLEYLGNIKINVTYQIQDKFFIFAKFYTFIFWTHLNKNNDKK